MQQNYWDVRFFCLYHLYFSLYIGPQVWLMPLECCGCGCHLVCCNCFLTKGLFSVWDSLFWAWIVVMQIIWERTALFLTTCLSSVKFMLVAQLVSQNWLFSLAHMLWKMFFSLYESCLWRISQFWRNDLTKGHHRRCTIMYLHWTVVLQMLHIA